jgi:hypothetical protein
MDRVKVVLVCCVGLLTSISSLALPRECNALMDKVEKRLQNKGIAFYTLEWIPESAPTTLRVVGRCSKERLKLIYAQHNKKPVTPAPESTPPRLTPLEIFEPVKQAEPLQPQPDNTVQLLIQGLHGNHGDFADRIQQLIDKDDTTRPLIAAYYGAPNDATFRFNVVLLLNQKIKGRRLGAVDIDATIQCLVDALKDTSPLVRGEALWGLGQTGNKKWASAVQVLLSDPDPAVRSEATSTYQLLR